MRKLGSVLATSTLLLGLTACTGTSDGDSAGSTPAAGTGTAGTTAAGAATTAAAAGQAPSFAGSTLDKSICAIITAADTTTLKMTVKGAPTAGQNQVSADQPVVYSCSWAFNDAVNFSTYPTAEFGHRIMSQTRRGEELVTDLVPGADEAYYGAGTGDQVKARLTVRAGTFSIGVSLNDTVATLSPDDAKQAAVGLAVLVLKRSPNLKK